MNVSHLSEKLIEYVVPKALIIKNTVIWGGHYVQTKFSSTIVPLVSQLWSSFIQSQHNLLLSMHASSSYTLIVSGVCLGIGFIAFKISQSHFYGEHVRAKTAWKLLGLAGFIASTAATTFALILITE